jgi:acylglycerol lipase
MASMNWLLGRTGLGAWLVAAAACLAACVPQIQDIGPDQGAPRLEATALVTGDQRTLPLRIWPAAGTAKGVVLALHGFNEYGEVFAAPAAIWARQGLTTYAYDQRGFGGAPERGIWAGREALVADAQAALRLIRAQQPKLPIYLVGESMGGAVAILTLADPATPPVDATVLSAPGVWGGPALNWAFRTTAWLGAHVMPGAIVTGRGLRRLASDNIEMLRGLGRDPLIIKQTRVDAVYGVTQLMGEAIDAAPALRTPLLVLYGGRDEIIPPRALRQLLQNLAAPHAFAFYPLGCHMLLRDLEGDAVASDVAEWLTWRADQRQYFVAHLPSRAERCQPPQPPDRQAGEPVRKAAPEAVEKIGP